VLGFAPFEMPLVNVAALSGLLLLWSSVESPRAGAWIGFFFGAGLFGVGTSWVYIALETFGAMPAPIAVLATAVFVTCSSLWTALAGWTAVRLTPGSGVARLLAAAAAYVLCEWLRSYLFTGFPWLAVGYAELPSSGGLPLAGYAPTGGVFLVSLMVASSAAAVAGITTAVAESKRRPIVTWLAIIAVIAVAGALQLRTQWTRPEGAPVAISLLQGNISQAQKFDPSFRPRNREIYQQLVQSARGRIVVMPESAFAEFADEIPGEVFARLASEASTRNGIVLAGLFIAEPPVRPGGEERIYNSVVGLDASTPQLYRKRHLVPFGETIPFKPVAGWFINQVLAIPLADQSAGPADQAPFEGAGQRLAVNICYEDAFGAELIPSARAATLLVNVTNDAWYGRSIAARQHNQIAAMRALETGRPMLRATNTGITAAIDHRGRVISELPWFVAAVLEVEIAGRVGDTPYLRFGDWPALVLAALLLLAAALWARNR